MFGIDIAVLDGLAEAVDKQLLELGDIWLVSRWPSALLTPTLKLRLAAQQTGGLQVEVEVGKEADVEVLAVALGVVEDDTQRASKRLQLDANRHRQDSEARAGEVDNDGGRDGQGDGIGVIYVDLGAHAALAIGGADTRIRKQGKAAAEAHTRYLDRVLRCQLKTLCSQLTSHDCCRPGGLSQRSNCWRAPSSPEVESRSFRYPWSTCASSTFTQSVDSGGCVAIS